MFNTRSRFSPGHLVASPPCYLVLCLAVLGLGAPVSAHPVPKKAHDRAIVVRLTPEAAIVEYRLELDEWTAVNDLVAVIGKEDLAKLTSPREIYAAFTRAYAPLLAANLNAKLDKQELEFSCVKHEHKVLDHLRCDFVFRAPWRPSLDRRYQFTFREGNYELESGRINLSLVVELPAGQVEKIQPDEALKARAPADLLPGDDTRLRKASANFTVMMPQSVVSFLKTTSQLWNMASTWGEAFAAQPAPPPEEPPAPRTLLGLLLDSRLGIWSLLGLAAAFGAVHALTPGHGKTLVAAYLVGEHGTAWHALLLGLVTTLTHTGVVMVLAVGLMFVPVAAPLLSFLSGLMVAGLGFWLLFRRLSGGPDHVHIGGHSHHHHHGPGADHFHDEHGHTHPMPKPAEALSSWGLIVLGISGGIVPCWDAIAMLGFAIAAQRIWLGLPLVLAFSAGLAGVLVAIGLLVVYLKGFAESRWGNSRAFRLLPLVSAALIAAMGLWLCYDSLHLEPAHTHAAEVSSRPRP
ncbi:MAG: hypothetical protein K2R98_12820 [Gemmataceae bacterium]|nr:hypothetical protein [Gemmataceae bacterium]